MVKPPLERPKPCLGVPLLRPLPPSRDIAAQCPAGQWMMSADDGAVDHLECVWDGSTLVEGLKNAFPKTSQCPTAKVPVNAGPLAELFGQVAPRRSCAGYPENPFKNKTVVGRLAAIRGTDRKDEVFKQRPFAVAHQMSGQAGLHSKNQLQSRQSASVNPFCQHGLSPPGVRGRMFLPRFVQQSRGKA